MSSRLLFPKGILPASRLCQQRSPNFRASVLKRSVSDVKSTPSSSVPAKPKIDMMDGPDTVKGRIHQLEMDIGAANTGITVGSTNSANLQNRIDTRFEWMLAFGIGTVLLGVGGAILKVYYYDISQEDRRRLYVQDTMGNLEKAVMSRIDNVEKVTTAKIDNLNKKIDRLVD